MSSMPAAGEWSDQVNEYGLSRRLVAEALGTGLLVATVIGSGIMGAALSPANDAIALLGNTAATGAILYVLILWLGPVSGAHFNPAVSLAFLARRELAPGVFVLYIAVQIAGGIAGAVLAHAMFELPLVMASTTARAGPAQFLSEVVATFGLVGVILGALAVRPQAVAAAVGLFISAGYWFTASTSFANPAVTIARTLTDTFSGIRPVDAPAFIAAQAVGALIAAVLVTWLMRPAGERKPAAAE